MLRTLWTEEYPANSVVMTARKRLGLVGALGFLQDIAWIHAAHLGFGYEEMLAGGTLWALTRQRLEMAEWPKWGERVEVRTWSRAPSGLQAYREFELRVPGRAIGRCSTTWLVLDEKTRRPRALNFKSAGAHHTSDLLDFEAAKLPPREGLEKLAVFEVRRSDLDLNGHVNNTRYAQWVLDAARETVAEDQLRVYEVNFLAETFPGDAVAVEAAGGFFQGRRVGDGKVVFTAQLG
jgi:medium-chain acyl-[acyl-carrier-protein] hydrolase